ncbi:MAG TPA: CPBP family intramembrane glutamic endopeptidase [bacterium]|jgi:membrane protease YdiL (CAAX protease family)|nr:CPBP family intramembrane glutamic endopeptidase [bacterium]
MTTVRAFIKSHPLLIYFALAFAISWGAILLLTGGLGPIGTTDPRFLFVALTAPVAPAIVGLLLTGLDAGRAGYRDVLVRLLRWRVGVRWYAVALLTAPLLTVTVAVLFALALRSTDFRPAILTAPDPLGLLLPGLVGGLVAGFCEELGWTGFAIPRLRLRYGVFATGLLVGVVWGAWHFPLFREGASFSGALPLALLLVQLFAWLPAYRVLMVWVYDRTGSLLVAVLMHASLIANQLIASPAVTGEATTLVWILGWGAALWVVVAAVAVAKGGLLSRQPLRMRVA